MAMGDGIYLQIFNYKSDNRSINSSKNESAIKSILPFQHFGICSAKFRGYFVTKEIHIND